MKRSAALRRAENELDMAWKEESEGPADWFGKLAALGVVCLFLDAVGWLTAFLSPRLNFALNLFLKFAMSGAIVGCSGLAIWAAIKGYQHEQAKKQLRETFVYEDPVPPA